MHSSNLLGSDTKQYYMNEVPMNSHDTYNMYQRLSKTFLDEKYNLSKSWELQKALHIRNSVFEHEFKEKSKELEEKSSFPEHWEVRYGFLATIKEKMIERVAADGLEVKMCPYNYLGYNIAGVHISQNADVCLTEAKSKIIAGDDLILILFQYMLGKRKIVAMHDPKNLLAPTPKFDSHICEERPDPKEKESLQYIKSLVYLYEFANGNLDPITRPRHCCPIAAMVFKNNPSYETLDLTGPEAINTFSAPYQSPLSLLKPVSQHTQPTFWGRQYPQSEYKKSSIVIQKNDEEDSRKVTVAEMEKELYNIEQPTSADDSWRPINYGQQYQSEAAREMLYGVPNGAGRNINSMLLKSAERDRSPERTVKNWSESSSSRGSRPSRGFDASRRGSNRGSKSWFK